MSAAFILSILYIYIVLRDFFTFYKKLFPATDALCLSPSGCDVTSLTVSACSVYQHSNRIRNGQNWGGHVNMNMASISNSISDRNAISAMHWISYLKINMSAFPYFSLTSSQQNLLNTNVCNNSEMQRQAFTFSPQVNLSNIIHTQPKNVTKLTRIHSNNFMGHSSRPNVELNHQQETGSPRAEILFMYPNSIIANSSENILLFSGRII